MKYEPFWAELLHGEPFVDWEVELMADHSAEPIFAEMVWELWTNQWEAAATPALPDYNAARIRSNNREKLDEV